MSRSRCGQVYGITESVETQKMIRWGGECTRCIRIVEFVLSHSILRMTMSESVARNYSTMLHDYRETVFDI